MSPSSLVGGMRKFLSCLGRLVATRGKLLPNGSWPEQEHAWVLQLRYDHQGLLIQGQTKRIEGLTLEESIH
jgi:hypothetical protein